MAHLYNKTPWSYETDSWVDAKIKFRLTRYFTVFLRIQRLQRLQISGSGKKPKTVRKKRVNRIFKLVRNYSYCNTHLGTTLLVHDFSFRPVSYVAFNSHKFNS